MFERIKISDESVQEATNPLETTTANESMNTVPIPIWSDRDCKLGRMQVEKTKKSSITMMYAIIWLGIGRRLKVLLT